MLAQLLSLRPRSRSACLALILGLICAAHARAQTTAATFGEVIRLGGTPSDIVLDESRMRLYLINANANRVDIWDYAAKALLSPIRVGNRPLAGAMSMDNQWLYVTNSDSRTLSVIDLGTGSVTATVPLPAIPEGVEVGADGRALISTQGSGVNNLNNTLLIYDRTQTGQQVIAVPFPPPPVTPPTLPAPGVIFRPQTTFRGKLARTPDGQFIVGLSVVNNGTQTIAYVYEVASGTLLKSRTVTGQSTVLSMAPDGSRFMAGLALYNTSTLAVMAQATTSNAPFPMPAGFNLTQNVGGSTFSPDGTTLYSAFNVAPTTQPPSRPSASILLISDPRHLGIKLGIRLPESIVAKMVITSDGTKAWGLSESGLIHLPLDTLYEHPIIAPETTQVFLSQDDCNRGVARATLRVNNLGSGKLTFSVPNPGASLIIQASSGLAPSTLTLTMEPGRIVSRQPGTNLVVAGQTLSGTPVVFDLISPEAINIPNRVRVYMNYRLIPGGLSDMRGIIVPIPTNLDNNQGLTDMMLDEARGKLLITNSGFNRIEVFDLKKQRLDAPIDTCQLPRQMAMGTDGYTLYVACQGSEGIGIVDLELGRTVGEVNFPPLPRSGVANAITPQTLAMGLSGLQFILNNGTVWRVVGNDAIPRTPTPVIGIQGNGQQTPVAGPNRYMINSPDLSKILVLGGDSGGAGGFGYLYDALADTFTSATRLFSAPITGMYYGPLAIAPDTTYMLANGLIMNDSLSVIGGYERPSTTQTQPPPAPGQPPVQITVSTGQRNVAALAALDSSTFLRLTTPVRTNVNQQTRDEVRTTLEAVDIVSGANALIGVVPENPVLSVFGQTLQRVPPRMMVADPGGQAAYAITLSGLSIIPLNPATSATRPIIAAGARGIVNSIDGSQNIRPGSFVTITGQNLASAATADLIPLPSVLGGSCVTFSDTPLHMISASPTQISAQIPEDLRPGLYVVQVRSLANAQASDPVVINVRRVE
jgi:YVTN family beta-propeller protein